MDKLYVELEGVFVEVRIINRRNIYGSDQVEVVPVSGFTKGPKWVKKEKVLKPADIKKIVKVK